jgi:phage gpG-like protein
MVTMTGGGVRLDSLVNIGYEFIPTIAISARSFDKLDLDIRSFRVPLKRSIQQVIAPSISQNFISNGRPELWVPYADDTIRVKGRDPNNRFTTENILRRSGLLWKTMQQYNIWTVTEKQAAILSLPNKIWYGQLHQAGYGSGVAATTQAEARGLGMFAGAFATPEELAAMGGGGVNIPARPFAMFQTKDMDRVQEVFAAWLQERVDADLAGIPAKSVMLCLCQRALRRWLLLLRLLSMRRLVP